jgi:hypothetical protein
MHSKTIHYTLILVIVLFFICASDAIFASDSLKDYSILIDLIKIDDKQGPFLPLNDFNKSFDQELHKASIEYFDHHPNIIETIRSDLNNQPIQWRLKNISQRLMYVPETRETYTVIFEKYCNDVIKDILRLTEFNNPYITIHTLGTSKPENSAIKGINAFIVHNLSKEYVATYIFSNNDQKEIAVELTGKIFLGEVGSYSSYISLDENGSFEFTRDHYTIWQNSAKNPYTALITPIEETLHIVLRRYTERSIQDRIQISAAKTLKEVKPIVDDWICVEEAIVGGLVYALLPSTVEKYIPDLPKTLVESDIKAKTEFKKYRHLRKGIKIVKQLGYKKSIKIYQDDPMAFRNLLM